MNQIPERTRIFRVKIEEGTAGLFYATSPDVRGLLVAKPDLESLEEAIPTAIRAGDNIDDFQPWVAMPAEIAQRELERVR
jgi:hypothetical protein